MDKSVDLPALLRLSILPASETHHELARGESGIRKIGSMCGTTVLSKRAGEYRDGMGFFEELVEIRRSSIRTGGILLRLQKGKETLGGMPASPECTEAGTGERTDSGCRSRHRRMEVVQQLNQARINTANLRC